MDISTWVTSDQGQETKAKKDLNGEWGVEIGTWSVGLMANSPVSSL
jgi:hypothetical protein